FDQMEHHIQGHRSAGRCNEGTVDSEDIVAGEHVWKSFLEVCQIFPMHRATAALQQAGFGKQIGARADASKLRASAVESSEPGQNTRLAEAHGLDAGANDDDIASRCVRYAMIDRN